MTATIVILAHPASHRRKTMPSGALGRIQRLALQLGLIRRSEAPVLCDPQMLVFAADHGIAAQGVSAYPLDVTWQMGWRTCWAAARRSACSRGRWACR